MSRLPANVVIDGVIYGVRATVEEIHVNEGVVDIGYGTLCGCPRLHTVVLPQSLRTIGDSAVDNSDCRSDIKNWMDGRSVFLMGRRPTRRMKRRKRRSLILAGGGGRGQWVRIDL